MNGQLNHLIHELKKANLVEEEVQQLWQFVQFLTYQRRFHELPLAIIQTAVERESHKKEAPPMLATPEELTYAVSFTETEYDQNPLIRLIGLAADGHLADDID